LRFILCRCGVRQKYASLLREGLARLACGAFNEAVELGLVFYGSSTLRRRNDMSGDTKGGLFQAIKEFIYGMAAHDSARFALKSRASMEHLFILITMGDMLGVPILPPYYSLRLLPYVVPQISTWKRRMLREKDLTDALA
jgi:hypothetical protein